MEFPLTNLLALYERGPPSLYTNYMSGFRLLVGWLGPHFSLDPTAISLDTHIPKLYQSYTLAQISEILNIHTRIIYGHSIKANELLQQANVTCMPAKVSAI